MIGNRAGVAAQPVQRIGTPAKIDAGRGQHLPEMRSPDRRREHPRTTGQIAGRIALKQCEQRGEIVGRQVDMADHDRPVGADPGAQRIDRRSHRDHRIAALRYPVVRNPDRRARSWNLSSGGHQQWHGRPLVGRLECRVAIVETAALHRGGGSGSGRGQAAAPSGPNTRSVSRKSRYSRTATTWPSRTTKMWW